MNRLSSNIPIRDRVPYFVKCSSCKMEMNGYDVFGLMDRCRVEGWKYDYENDKVYCPKCVSELNKEVEDNL